MKKIVPFLFGVIIFLGLPLVGWGLNDIRGFIANPFRLAYLVLMMIMSVLVIFLVPHEGRGSGKGKAYDRKHGISLFIIQVISVIMVMASAFFDRRSIMVLNDSSLIRLTGLILMTGGFAFMNWAIIVLGNQFSVYLTLQEGHQLITKGPYKYIRHPRYLGILVFFTGISLVFLSIISLSMVVFLLAALFWRIKDEERLMEKEFGEEWRQYQQRTKSLIPFLL